jgi:probable rRNA maturation factor
VSVDLLNESGIDTDLTELAGLGRFVLDRMRIHPQAQLCVKLVDAETIANLNHHYLDHAEATDVLAFPMDELRPGRPDEEPADGIVGDVALCPEVAGRQAAAAGHTLSAELQLLTVHGILHLLGYDHAEPDEHAQMFGLQGRLLAEWQATQRGEALGA